MTVAGPRCEGRGRFVSFIRYLYTERPKTAEEEAQKVALRHDHCPLPSYLCPLDLLQSFSIL